CQEGLTYGSGCTKQCAGRHCLQNSPCNTNTGRCVGGCQSGWREQDCSLVCYAGRYGPSCSLQCSSRHCKTSSTSTCNPVNGSCDNGCQSGWQGIDCTDCKGGLTYGNYCDKRCADRHCLNNSTCAANTGLCVGGCQPGWKDVDCSKVCHWPWYGPNCSLSCTDRHCSGQSGCNKTDGKCETGCQTRWKGVDCLECNDRYGANCSLDCRVRHCKNNNSLCDPRTGECVRGCKPGWMNATCTQQCAEGFYGDGCSNQCENRKCYINGTCDFQTGQCSSGCQAGWEGQSCTSECTNGKYGMNCTDTCGECAHELCDRVTGNCTGGCSDGFEGHLCKERIIAPPLKTGLIAGIAVSVLVVILLVVIITIVLMRRRRGFKAESREAIVSSDSVKGTRPRAKRETQERSEYVNVAFTARPVPEGTEDVKDEKPVKNSAVRLSVADSTEELDELKDDDESPGSVYYNISDFSLPEGGAPVGELLNVGCPHKGFEIGFKQLISMHGAHMFDPFCRNYKDVNVNCWHNSVCDRLGGNGIESYLAMNQDSHCDLLMTGRVFGDDVVNGMLSVVSLKFTDSKVEA
ncbi:multiple epidermal growth factor-like domains protein 10, partial [Gigantopelta aegis]|uniref:multiple epidermal growth factor-like domains protein 10 n=1 Tax=Gigantopelta aegis TaxID=1735272 RepID=UPI001B88BCD5